MGITAEEALGASRSYTDKSIAGGGAIIGKNCTIDSIVPITGGNRVTFKWTLDNGTVQTDTMDVMDGTDGKGIASVTVNAQQHLIITYTDGTITDAGEIDVQSAVDSVNGQTGNVVLGASDVGALPDNTAIPTKLSDLSDDTTHRTVTDTEKSTWSGKADISDIPTKLSDFTNDSGFVTNTVNNLTNYYLKSETYTKAEVGQLIQAITTLDIQAVSTLPTTDISTTTIYLVPKQNAQSPDVKDEYINLDGTTTGWELIGNTQIDLSNYVTTSDLNTALSTKQDSLTFDNVPTQNSNNPVKSGGIFSAIDDVYSVMGQNGAKNLIPYPFKETTKTVNGITFTDNGDGTITANGTATDTAAFSVVLGNTALSANGNLTINTNKPLILSGCPSGGGNNTYRIQYGLTDGTSYWAKTASDTGSGVTLTPIDGLNSYCFDVIRVMVFNGYTANNLTFKPMLRLASDTDNTYQPYAKTNKRLTDDKTELVSVRDYVNEFGAKNLIPYPYYEKTNTADGITWTDNGDGTVTANGTATQTTYFTMTRRTGDTNMADSLVEGESYTLTGCPAGGSNQTYDIFINETYEGAEVGMAFDYGNGATFILNHKTETNYGIGLRIRSGQTVSNLTFKPMLRLASDINDDTYVPFAMTNKQLTDKLEKCWKLDAGTVIPDNSDLNNYKTPGNYYHLTANVSTVSNIPDNKGFRLTVLLDLYDPAFVEQIFNPIGSYKIYKRYYSTSNTWTDWKVVEDVIGDLSQTGLTGDSVAEQLTTAYDKVKRLTPVDENYTCQSTNLEYTGLSVSCPAGHLYIVRAQLSYSNSEPTEICACSSSSNVQGYTTYARTDKASFITFLLTAGETAYIWGKWATANKQNAVRYNIIDVTI